MKVVVCDKRTQNAVQVGTLAPGTPLLLSSGNNHFYIKVDESKLGQGMIQTNPSVQGSVLFNPVYGTLRKVPNWTIVEVRDAELRHWELPKTDFPDSAEYGNHTLY